MQAATEHDQSASESPLARYAREFAGKMVAHKEEYGRTNASAVVFRIGEELYALPTVAVREVIEAPKIHSLPRLRGTSILGLANCRGELVLCVSLQRLLGVPGAPDAAAETGPMLLLSWQGMLTACPVDSVQGVCRFKQENMRPLPAGAQRQGLVLGLLEVGECVASVLSADAISARPAGEDNRLTL